MVEFQRGRSPLADGATRHVGCVLSDELLEALFRSAEVGGIAPWWFPMVARTRGSPEEEVKAGAS